LAQVLSEARRSTRVHSLAMLVLAVLTSASARLFMPAAPATDYASGYSAPAPAQPMLVNPVMPTMIYDDASADNASWALPAVAMLGLGGVAGFFAAKKAGGDASVSRRDFLGAGAALAAGLAAPGAAFADGASSKAVKERSRAIYGSRVFRLQGKSTEAVLEDKNAFKLFITGAYRTDEPELRKQLTTLSTNIVKAAKAGDSGETQKGLKEFIALGKIRETDVVKGGNFDPTQRRNPGAPPTAEIEAQMGTQAFALYKPLPSGSKAAINK